MGLIGTKPQAQWSRYVQIPAGDRLACRLALAQGELDDARAALAVTKELVRKTAAPIVVLTSVTNSEADDSAAGGDGSTRQDVQEADFWTEDTEFLLRAERAGKGDGRTYTITYSAVDASGNETQAQAVVEVPHDSSDHHCEDPDCDLNGA